MQAEFWHQRWASNQIGFHESAVNPLLVAHIDALALSKDARVFLPLCGKTVDIDWLLARGVRVAGIELSELAVHQLFERLGVAPAITRSGGLERRSAANLDIFVGDFFALTAASLGAVDAVYDRAALIALPAEMRTRYVTHMESITAGAPQLLVTLDYDQAKLNGPPFSVSAAEVQSVYGARRPTLLASHDVVGGLKGSCPATENAWLLASNSRAGPRPQ